MHQNRVIYCEKLGVKSEGLSSPPFPNVLGQRIYMHISQKAWDLWLAHQTMLINEYKLSMIDKKARDFLMQEMEKFLFGGGAEKPPGFHE
ncbi:MAG TPA: oxidative damage protection protein [Coxiellaceae bacterium]|nr:MAG: oxidative damage protection protein [Gammaproteobacteria bacterium RIFCSPHIGHO2_12_FULL_36_30]HLB57136.1 oxidative damage protection protein [Coxiellaceae bacterium]